MANYRSFFASTPDADLNFTSGYLWFKYFKGNTGLTEVVSLDRSQDWANDATKLAFRTGQAAEFFNPIVALISHQDSSYYLSIVDLGQGYTIRQF